MLVVENLSKEYRTPGGSLPILSDVSLRMKRGDAVAHMADRALEVYEELLSGRVGRRDAETQLVRG